MMPEPKYPYALSRAAIKGNVEVEFLIGSNGKVLEAKAIKSTHKGFESAAVEAVLKWRFKPGIKKGRAVNVRARQLLEFNFLEHALVYPFDLLMEGKDGSATVGYWLDEGGQLKRSQVLETTSPAFGKAAQAMLADELNTSAQNPDNHENGMSRTTYSFKSDGLGQATVSLSAREILKLLRKGKAKFAGSAELDQPITPLRQQPPVYPVSLRSTEPKGTVLVEFFIDRKGLVQLPRVVSTTHEDFGYAAAQAVGNWSFKPPQQKGKPVIVRTQLPLEFIAPVETK